MYVPRSVPRSYCPRAADITTLKKYNFNIPVFAGPAEEDTATAAQQAEWNNLKRRFTITKADGTAETYEVAQNMANPATASAKIYPNTGVADEKGNTYFKYNTWGFAVTPRNMKQYNYQMLIDSLLWERYRIEGVSIQWTPNQGEWAKGEFKAQLVSDAQTMPNWTSMSNAVTCPATKGAFKSFSVEKVYDLKNMRSVQREFDLSADTSILWIKCAGLGTSNPATPGVTSITEVGTLTINIEITVSRYSPSPYAQLIGPWIEAGYPIDSQGGDVVQTIKTTTGTEMIGVEADSIVVDKQKIARGRAAMPKWRVIGSDKDRFICALPGKHASKKMAMKIFNEKLKRASDGVEKWPVLTSVQADGYIHGDDFLNNASSGADEMMSFVIKPDAPLVDNGAIYVDANPTIRTPVVPGSNDGSTAYQLAYYVSNNTYNIANGGVYIPYKAAGNAGTRVGATLVFSTSFAPGSITPEGEFAEATLQPALGYKEGDGVIAEGVEPPSDGVFGDMIRAALIAGAQKLSNSNGDPNPTQSFKRSNAITNAGKHKGSWQMKSGNGPVEVQAASFTVPENAAFCTIGEYPAASVDAFVADAMLKPFPAAKKYGLVSFSPASMTNDQARITVTGEFTSMYSTVVAIEGVAATLGGLNVVPVQADSRTLCVLVASKVNPVEDVDGFYNTAVPITGIAESMTDSSVNDSLYINRDPSTAKGIVFTQTHASGQRILQSNSVCAAFGTLQLITPTSCNFTVAFPNKLVDKAGNLVDVKPGDEIFFSLIRTTALTVSHTINETAGDYNFWIMPNIAKGTDKAAAGGAGFFYNLEIADGTKFSVSSVEVRDERMDATAEFVADGERRFSLQVSTPSGGEQAPVSSSIRCIKRA